MTKMQPFLEYIISETMTQAVQNATHEAVREAVTKVMLATVGGMLAESSMKKMVDEITRTLARDLDLVIEQAFN